ncbi:MAG: hypothetical protein M3Y27_27695, partial [Acidobacteriota bacterium]|nr:hypothetical protein [Acidobacteriota bacterium]
MYLALRSLTIILAGASTPAFSQSGPLTVSPSPLLLCGRPNQVVSGAPLFVSTSTASSTFIATTVSLEGDWLQVEPSFATLTAGQPFQLLVGINAGGQTGGPLYNSIIPFSNGDYTGQIILSSVDGAKLATIPVLLRVSASGCDTIRSGAIYSNSGPLTFQLPPSTTAGVTLSLFNSFRTNVTIAPTVSTATGQKWITTLNNNLNIVTGPLYPTPFSVNVTTEGLSPGTSYNGNIELDSSSYSILNLPLALNVSPSAGSARFAVTPSPLSLTIPKDTTTTSVNIALTNLTPAAVGISVTPSASNGKPWLTVSPAAALLQPNETVMLAATIDAAALSDGANRGSVNVQTTAGPSGSLIIPVTVKAGIATELTAAPNPLNLSTIEDVIGISSNAGVVSFSTKTFSSTTQPWLTITPYYATVSPGMPVNLTVDVNPALVPPGPAVGIITLIRTDGSTLLTIPVNVNSGKDSALSVTPAQLSFSYPAGSPFPQTQTLSLTNLTPTNYTIQSTTSAGGKWLAASPNTATTKVTVQVNPSGLPPNTYQGQVAITNTNSGAQQIVPVTLTVGPPLPVPVGTLVSSASLSPGPVSPGEFVTIFGPSLSGTTVTFDSYPAPVIYADTQQVNAIVPYEIAGRSLTNVVVYRNGVPSIPLPLQVADTAPAIFNGILNADNSYNSASNPAAKGSVIQIFATGEGLYPGAATGSVVPSQPPFPVLTNPVRVTMGGFPAELQYFSEAPGLLSGVLQVNAVIPDNTDSGPQKIVLTVGANSNT